ncbi:MAG: NADH-quinone oxidoreductase subunit L [Acidimicrobiales bacterium]
MLELVWLIPALPLAGFVVLLLVGRRLGEPFAGWLATLMVAGSFGVAVAVWAGLLAESERFFGQVLFEWVPAGSFSVDVGFLVDPLSMTMVLFITGIGALIHLYAIGYMHGDENFSKFFVYLNLFVFSMLLLVLGDNLLLTFLGWEGVGVCSYFLISFWFTEEANASAGKKAFVTNRIGDWGFMVATFLAFQSVGSIRYADLLTAAPGLPAVTATAISLLLFVGAVGKSAQIPLYVWLPDAMAGPTPVSALIHAATMVTAGVYLMTRTNPLLAEAYDWAPTLIAWVGAVTALLAATIAVAQNDIKKVLAYSTVSQLGYLFLAVGSGAYVAAIFHMITHAFFKALLFLGAGSVIHGVHDEQDMRRMGGLARFMPVTAATFVVGWLAIAGVPPFSGFWSKDEILAYAFDKSPVLWAVGLVTALLTAFYMSRQVFMTFFGRLRYADPTYEEINAGWDAKLVAAQARAADARDAAGTARGDIDAAEERFAAAQAKAVDAERAATAAMQEASSVGDEQLAAARAAVTAAGDDRAARREADRALKALEKLGKDAEKAQAAALKAQDEADRAGAAITTAERLAADAGLMAESEQAAAAKVESEAQQHRPRTAIFDLRQAPDVARVTEHLPEAVAQRREYHPHESPWLMTAPLVVLALGAVGAGLLNLPFSDSVKTLEHWLEPAVFGNERVLGLSGGLQVGLAALAVAGAALGVFAAYAVYLKGKGSRRAIELPILARAWGIDEAYAAVAGGPGRALFAGAAWFDRTVIDGIVNGVAWVVRMLSSRLRVVQTGFVRTYALTVAVGALALLGFLLSRATF